MTCSFQQPGSGQTLLLCLGAFLVFATIGQAAQELFINEIMAVNQSTTHTETGVYADWIELWNKSPLNTQNLSGMYLSDTPATPTRWQFPPGASIPPRGYLLIWADDTTVTLPGPPYHCNFRLSGTEGETLGLYAADGRTSVDIVVFGSQAPDVSYARVGDGTGAWGPFGNPTPMKPNFGYVLPPEPAAGILFINEWMMSNRNGIEDAFGEAADWIEIYNAGDIPIDLGGYFITDDLLRPTKFEIYYGNVVGPRGHVILWADDDEEDEGRNHLGFNLNKDGEPLGLFEKPHLGYALIDAITTAVITRQYTDVSQGRRFDGAWEFDFFSHPTPRATNYTPSTEVRTWMHYR